MIYQTRWSASFTRKQRKGKPRFSSCVSMTTRLLPLRLIVRFDDELVTRFEDEDDFIIELEFDNQKGHFDMYIRYWSITKTVYSLSNSLTHSLSLWWICQTWSVNMSCKSCPSSSSHSAPPLSPPSLSCPLSDHWHITHWLILPL